ncbi:hypothetical protein VNI00_007548 [Paramarasmius palmivorus]|uniref:Uncharacterized protein n=1 Tax=Paramarasmius palmivorus TaxID=297713 RepID=A0AAW0D3Q7_9AGAR
MQRSGGELIFFGRKIPYILLTNGGGSTEEKRAEKLSKSLGVTIDSEQIIQAHTILKDLVGKYGDSPVLVLGGKNDDMRFVAESYGFKKAYTTADVLLWNPSVWPFQSFDPAHMKRRLPVDFSKTRIEAVLVFHDPRNWGTDVQIMCDVIQSDGIIGNPYVDPDARTSRPVEVIFCNPDLLWKSDFSRPRLGQGAFRESFQAVYKALSGTTYPFVQFGKPTTPTYKYAEKIIHGMIKRLYGENASFPSMYMIGDNPASDIAGANGAKWNSVLVHTGVYDPSLGQPQHKPTQEAKDVEAAVRWAIERAIAGA